MPVPQKFAADAPIEPIPEGVPAKFGNDVALEGQPSPVPARSVNPEDRTFSNYAKETAYGVGRGLKNDVQGVVQTVTHPIDTVSQLLKQANDTAQRSVQEYKDNSAAPVHQRVAASLLTALEGSPVVGGMVQQAEKGGTALASPESVGAAAEGTTTFAAPELLGNGVKAASGRVGDIYPKSTTLTPEVAKGRQLGKALAVEPKALPRFIDAASQEAGTIVDYAKNKGIRINSTLDLANAAKGAAKELQDHYINEFVKPHADKVVSVPPDYRGAKLNVEGSRATLGDINSRVDEINKQLSPNYRKKMQMETNTANISDEDLIAEKRKLTSLLQDKLSESTGVSSEDISHLRRKAGKLRDISEEAQLSADTNTSSAGRQGGTGSSLPTNKAGLVDKVIEKVQGGPEIIGNRRVKSAMKDVEPKSYQPPSPAFFKPALSSLPVRDELLQKVATKQPLTESEMQELRKTPKGRKAILESMVSPSPTTPVDSRPNLSGDYDLQGRLEERQKGKAAQAASDAALAAKNKAIAEQEFLHASNLEEMARQSAQNRNNAAIQHRANMAATNKSQALQEFLHSQNLQDLAQQASEGRGMTADQYRVAVKKALYNWRTGR